MSQETLAGSITRSQSGFFNVHTDQGDFVCRLRGRFKHGRKTGDIAAVGDVVRISLQGNQTGMIEAIEPRESELIRLAPTPRGTYCQVLVANPDQVVLVFACANPKPKRRLLDRFLVVCEKQQIPVLIVANKVDLVGLQGAKEIFSLYSDIDYEVIYTSAESGRGVDELKERLVGKLSCLAGPSGVGKSSLLNVIQPELGLQVRAVSSQTAKGRHTTVVREMFPLDAGGYVVDLPGLRMLAMWDTEPEELDGYFPELRHLVKDCQFSDCTHLHEPGCAVREAVEQGQVHVERYQSYLRMRYGDDLEEFQD